MFLKSMLCITNMRALVPKLLANLYEISFKVAKINGYSSYIDLSKGVIDHLTKCFFEEVLAERLKFFMKIEEEEQEDAMIAARPLLFNQKTVTGGSG